jgi:putative pyruvate formate lyase activating enzyme
VNSLPKVAAMSLHPWEEPPISGTKGSGTIFFSGCTLKCIYCQNYPISQMGVGRYLSVEELSAGMLRLQRRGAHNINLVTATHQMPAFVRALCIAVPQGLHIPLVYNSSGYENTQILPLLEDVIDIYLPDIKYDDPAAAKWCSQSVDYIANNRAALIQMWRQVGPLQLDKWGVAVRGLLIRHLVLPENLSGTRNCLAFLARELGPDVWVSLMNQYFPAYKAAESHPLDRKVSEQEYRDAFQALLDLGLDNGYAQDSCKRGDGTGL